jgi:endothelin-converting enzyme/putative endopeptidase
MTGSMQKRLVVSCVGPALFASLLAAACSVPTEDASSVGADDLTAMAAPGVDESALNRAVDPCTDFYEFACGGYIASLPADTRREIRSFAQLSASNTEVLGRVFAAILETPRSEAERNATSLFKSCMSTTSQARTTEFVAAFRSEIEAATTPDALARVVARLHRRGVMALFSFMPTADSEARGRHGTALAYAGGYDRRTDYTKPEASAARVTKLVGAMTAAEPTLTTDVATRMATSAVAVERSLASAASQGGQSHDAQPHPVGQAGLEAAAPHVDWKSYFTTLGRSNLGSFGVDNLDFFSALDALVTSASLDDVHAYLTARWYEAEQPTPATADSCQQQVESAMSDAIEPRFLELAGVDAKAQAKARALWGAIVDAFGEELKAEPFLDVSTRVEAEVKLGKMRGAIGASRNLDTFTDVDLAESDPYVENAVRLAERSFDQQLAQIGKPLPLLHIDFPAPIVNASYDGELNKINVPGGILGGYFFSASAPNLANFAAIGAVLGHELTHGFDNNGRHLDGDGVERDWWTPAVETAFNDRAQCLVDEYSAFTLPGVTDPATGQTPAHINGKRTLGENIADNGGVKTAYHASKVESMTGPVIAGFTPAQQFFVSYGQLWCGKTAPDVAAQNLTRDSHSPEKARVNVPLANFDAFAAAFQCQAGTPMAPANRCGVW